MSGYGALGLDDFLRTYRGMDAYPVNSTDLHIEGAFEFAARAEGHDLIQDCYKLRILVPAGFPQAIPIVHELEGRIPQRRSYHVNPADGSLCLGSQLRLLLKLAGVPTISGFAESCLIPYLYAVSKKLLHGGGFVFGELDHGSPGELSDYVDLFGVKTTEQARTVVRCLGMKKRQANKLLCPCGCGCRLGKCRFNKRVRGLRKLATRNWFRALLTKQK